MHGMTRIVAIVSVLRDITGGALTGLVVGIVVLGIGGRIVMRLATVLDPASVGQLTENGNVIGDVTIEGTVALVFFGGILTGLAAAVVWIAIQAWIPGDRWARAVLSMPIAVALTGFQLVRPENSDSSSSSPLPSSWPCSSGSRPWRVSLLPSSSTGSTGGYRRSPNDRREWASPTASSS
jgi:hypothetical protein